MKQIDKRMILVNVLGVMIARSAFFGINPLALGFFAAVYLEKKVRGYIFLSVLAGMATRMPLIDVAKYGLSMLAIMLVTALIENQGKKITVGIIASLSAVVITIMGITKGMLMVNSDYYIILAILEGVVVFAATGIFERGIDYILYSKKGQVLNNEQIISLSIIVGVFVYAIPRYDTINFSFVETGAYFLVLLLGYKYGAGTGSIAGAACGIVLGIQNNTISVIGTMCILGILAGMFREVGRIGAAIAFLLGALVFQYLYSKNMMELSSLRALSSSTILFLLLPSSLIYKIDIGERENGENKEDIFIKDNIQSIAVGKLKEFSESFKKLSYTFQTISEKKSILNRQDIDRIFDDVSEKLCKKCSKCDFCWKKEFYDTYKAAFSMLSSAERNGYIMEGDVPDAFLNRCINMKEFLQETNKSLELAKINLNWKNRMADSREAIALQLSEVANILDDFSLDLYDTVSVSETMEEYIIHKMRINHIEVKQIAILEKRNKKQEIYMEAKTEKGRCITTREAAGMLSEILLKRMKPKDGTKNVIAKEYDTIAFVEDTNYKALTGIARATKIGERISGDNYSFITLPSGEMIMTLSDGMGSGVKACTESQSVIELLEQFMEAGFKEESAIKLINSILVLKSEEESFSTVDMGILNLYTGVCDFIKIGAASTFIIRDNHVETITSASMPIGVFNQVDFEGISKKIYDGDYIVMVTDGVLECLPIEEKEAYMEKILMDSKITNAGELANYILEKAIEQNNHTAKDDMTVMVAGIWKK
ncbi:stage II sporulation protein E [Anaeromicropila herbilytica]|uniref:Stage II sporulation protein E n=1 Tax=Anaeromicropila herbilytica TaxID=2785025 RepID=A0A7R7IBP0_9FIRM|nr:stage II sporulation protein E [Anaeromicropila herbilytica]BCN28986.1 stage II sporulation protein E [Anaeromicropila herbilytica]